MFPNHVSMGYDSIQEQDTALKICQNISAVDGINEMQIIGE